MTSKSGPHQKLAVVVDLHETSPEPKREPGEVVDLHRDTGEPYRMPGLEIDLPMFSVEEIALMKRFNKDLDAEAYGQLLDMTYAIATEIHGATEKLGDTREQISINFIRTRNALIKALSAERILSQNVKAVLGVKLPEIRAVENCHQYCERAKAELRKMYSLTLRAKLVRARLENSLGQNQEISLKGDDPAGSPYISKNEAVSAIETIALLGHFITSYMQINRGLSELIDNKKATQKELALYESYRRKIATAEKALAKAITDATFNKLIVKRKSRKVKR